MMNAICNSAAPTGLNIGWGADMTQGFRSASPHCTPAYTRTSPNGLPTTHDNVGSPNGLLTPNDNMGSPYGLLTPNDNVGSPNGLLTAHDNVGSPNGLLTPNDNTGNSLRL